MGYGDWIICTSTVKRAYEKIKKPLVVGDGTFVEWNEIFEGNEKISKYAYKGCYWVRDYSGHRPYIDYLKSTNTKTVYRQDYKVSPGEIYLDFEEKAKYREYRDCIYIEPNVKGSYSGNKDWGFERWQKVVDRLPDLPWVQGGSGEGLRGVRRVETSSFRDACRLLSNARLFVGTDGGLHHAAAALGKMGVVVWGGLVSPKILGYDAHINLHSGTSSCGSHGPCLHCKKALDWVTVDMVVSAIESLCHRDSGVSGESRSRGSDEGAFGNGLRQPVSGGLGECTQGA